MDGINDLIISMELSLLDKNIRNNKDKLRDIISNDFIECGSSGEVYTYDDTINLLPNENEEVNYSIFLIFYWCNCVKIMFFGGIKCFILQFHLLLFQ